jgi:soluble epoxide hydrolase / lipid-phosphate phosphatase
VIELPESRHHIDTPTLYVGATRDPLSPPSVVQRMKPFRKDLAIDEVDTQHWIMLEKPDELNQKMEKWLKERF